MSLRLPTMRRLRTEIVFLVARFVRIARHAHDELGNADARQSLPLASLSPRPVPSQAEGKRSVGELAWFL